MEKYIYYTNGELEMTEDECGEYHEAWLHRLWHTNFMPAQEYPCHF